jgi:uracil-DNA glycosylase family 4
MDFATQLQQHLAALKAAGIDYLPRPTTSIVPLEAPKPTRLVSPMVVESASPVVVAAPPTVTEAPDDNRVALQMLAKEIEPCSRCPELFSTRRQTVFGVGKLEPDICFVGEAPGADEDRQGEPFVGVAGQLLNKIITACGYRREDVYICNILKCRPPGNRNPLPEEAENCRGYLERQIALVKPRYLVALGGIAAKNLLNTSTGIMKLRGKMYEFNGIPLMCTLHPSYLLRTPAAKKDCWDDMKTLLKVMGKPIPNAG